MKHVQVTTLSVEAQQICAIQHATPFEGMGAIERQPYFKPITRRALMTAVNTVSKDLGLRAASVVVVDALLSCLPCKDTKTGVDAPITPMTLLTVFAANDTLCFRAKGITDRQLRRHLERLESVGLIQRRDSANGKRFPIHRGGKVIGAFGIDLSPLLARSEEFLTLAEKRRQEADELRGLKSYIYKLRSECALLCLDEEVSAFVEGTRNIMRRAGATLTQARAIVAKLTDILMGTAKENDTPLPASDTVPTENMQASPETQPSVQTIETGKTPATDGQNVRHNEPPKSYTKKTTHGSISNIWLKLDTISAFYPKVPKTEHDLHQVIFDFGRLLRIGPNTLAKAISTLGNIGTLMAQDRIAAKADHISNPDAYLSTIMEGSLWPRVGHGQLSHPT